MELWKNNNVTRIAVIGGIIVLIIIAVGMIWIGRSANQDTGKAVRAVSLLYLDELAGRREQVVESNLQTNIRDIDVAVGLMTEEDLSDMDHLQAYQSRMKQLYNLEKFAFIDTEGLIYTSKGTQDNIDDYSIDYQKISGPEISILNLETPEKKVIIAIPVDLRFQGKDLKVCFMEINMQEMLSGVSMTPSQDEATFCNIYTQGGIALSNTVLGGLAVEDNLLDAMENARFEAGYSYDSFLEDFQSGQKGEVSFTYNDIPETLSYVPVNGTDWMLTYLIRESVISNKISDVTRGIIVKSVIQSILAVLALLIVFAFVFAQSRRNARMRLEHEKKEAENQIKHEEMEHRLALQEQLLQEEKRRNEEERLRTLAEKKRKQADQMITAMATDYRSIYYIDLDADDAVCYRRDPEDTRQHDEGVHFPYLEAFRRYGNEHVDESYREGFLKFIEPGSIRERLGREDLLTYRYLVNREGRDCYEMIRVAGVRHKEDRDDNLVHAIGLGFTNIDAEMRETMAQQQALSDALNAAEQANKAKTAFLSNMSHEIRTPMNAIIGLDNIALNDPETPERTKGYLSKIGDSAEHLLNLINDILDMSRIESGRMRLKNEEFSFRKMLDAINTMFSSQCQDKDLDYHCHIRGEVDDFYIGDDMKLRQVLINILGNAVKFTPEGGSVDLAVERTAQFDGRSTLCFTISDTGIGMSKEFLPRIFDTFTQEDSSSTNRYGSSGLGLAITRSIVEMMNGDIRVESEKGSGTRFYVKVTLSDSERKEGAGIPREVDPREMTVLVVDDDPVASEHAKLVLEKAGIAAEIAASGPEAVEMVKLRHARRNPYNLILIDWKMPEMDGVEATRQMRSVIGHESAIIILTAYRWDDVLEEALQAGVDGFIPKPLFASAVLEEFRSAAGRKWTEETKAHKAQLEGRRVLLAEDVKINAEIIVLLLHSRQMKVEVAKDGKIALDMFAASTEGYYDAVLMDMRMPEMDGLEATRRIRALDRSDAGEIPIIALTANAFDEDVQQSLQAGLNAHLSKPVQPETLYGTLESLIRD